jgi:hypothetical protein
MDTLDVSWIQEEEKLMAMDSIPEKEPLRSVQIRCLFADIDGTITHTDKITQELDVSAPPRSILSKDVLMELVETAKRKYASTKQYSLADILVWNTDIDADALDQEYTATPTFTKGSIFRDVVFPPSLFIFHSVQCVYILFLEKPQSVLVRDKKSATKKQVRFVDARVRSTRKQDASKGYKHLGL